MISFAFEIFVRSISGYVFMVPGIILYFLYLKKRGKKQTKVHIFTVFIFCYLLIGMLTVTGINSFKAFTPRVVLVPFLDMVNGPIDTLLNIVLFIPFGFLVPLLYKKYYKPNKIVLLGFMFSLSIETIQMFGMGSTDINDLITNVIGTFLGCCIYKSISKKSGDCEKFKTICINDSIEILMLTVYSFIIMITIQPIIIASLFKLA